MRSPVDSSSRWSPYLTVVDGRGENLIQDILLHLSVVHNFLAVVRIDVVLQPATTNCVLLSNTAIVQDNLSLFFVYYTIIIIILLEGNFPFVIKQLAANYQTVLDYNYTVSPLLYSCISVAAVSPKMCKPSMVLLLAIAIILHLNIEVCSGVDYWVGTCPPRCGGAPPPSSTTPSPQHSCDICIVGRRRNQSLCRKCVVGKY